ncbi:TetR family transcriptional regulator [Mycolicibacterium litorale]|uniref:TetR family transcriptional regulator n=1 Tax=Mycolicibacterium litorale TaxID=758802 RepID=UPI003CF6A6AE
MTVQRPREPNPGPRGGSCGDRAVSREPAGLRERKKRKTRATIRREAFRLIREQGYHNTTVEQIAAAADISPRTFSRYFPTKEAVLLSDDQIEPIVTAFAEAPAELSVIDAYRYAVETTFGALTEEQRQQAVAGQRLMYEVPEARGLLYTEYVRLIDLITEALTTRRDQPADALERRVLAGAIVGVLIAASHNTPMPGDPISRSLRVLDEMLK